MAQFPSQSDQHPNFYNFPWCFAEWIHGVFHIKNMLTWHRDDLPRAWPITDVSFKLVVSTHNVLKFVQNINNHMPHCTPLPKIWINQLCKIAYRKWHCFCWKKKCMSCLWFNIMIILLCSLTSHLISIFPTDKRPTLIPSPLPYSATLCRDWKMPGQGFICL